jgi:hypothetical protein
MALTTKRRRSKRSVITGTRRYRYGYYPRHRYYWRPWYYRPYYGYGYRPYRYGYWNRPYYRRW